MCACICCQVAASRQARDVSAAVVRPILCTSWGHNLGDPMLVCISSTCGWQLPRIRSIVGLAESIYSQESAVAAALQFLCIPSVARIFHCYGMCAQVQRGLVDGNNLRLALQLMLTAVKEQSPKMLTFGVNALLVCQERLASLPQICQAVLQVMMPGSLMPWWLLIVNQHHDAPQKWLAEVFTRSPGCSSSPHNLSSDSVG